MVQKIGEYVIDISLLRLAAFDSKLLYKD